MRDRENIYPPLGHDPYLPADHQGIFDPGNDTDDVLLDEDGEPVILDDADEDTYDSQDE